MDSYEKATLKDEFCYRQFSDSTADYNLVILPPLFNQGGDCTANALVYALEARYRKAGMWPPPISMKYLRHNLQDLADSCESSYLNHCSLTMGCSLVGLNSVTEPTDYELMEGEKEVIEEVTDDGELTDEEHKYFGFSSINNYTLVRKWAERKWAEETDETMKFDDVVKEIRNNGPVLATFFPDWDFSYWSMEYARNFIYEGLYLAELSEADKKKHRADKKKHRGHVVVLIGFGSGEKEYFIAQNSYGLNWGDNGMFRLDPRCVRRVTVPIL